ncbi:Uncharacterised protein [Yersinia frederiksenii]|uniref:Uncharacterized protein n=1 Tax=Yersinia frederiksenii TaxID=29484 RepID=A0AAI8ZQP8_YERFR|nr:Uncharacterised protein [Yersinia frederiksenii]
MLKQNLARKNNNLHLLSTQHGCCDYVVNTKLLALKSTQR